MAATCRASVQKICPLEKITPGFATPLPFSRKMAKYQVSVKNQGKKLRIIAVNSAGCPAPTSQTHLGAIAATLEPDEDGIGHGIAAHLVSPDGESGVGRRRQRGSDVPLRERSPCPRAI